MNNKQHEFIIRAFLESKIPEAIRKNAPQLLVIDSVIGGYCTQLLKAKDGIEILSEEIFTADEKKLFSKIINESSGKMRDEVILYYRLAILTQSVLYQYRL